MNIFRTFHRLMNENVQQRTIVLSSRIFEGQFQFHVWKKPQNNHKMVEKKNKLWHLFDNPLNF